MLPAVICNVPNTIGVGAFEPAGFVGNGDGAPAGAAAVVVTVIEVPDAIVVSDANVTLELHEPSVGRFTGVPSTGLTVTGPDDAEEVLHGKLELGFDDGAVLGAVDGPVLGLVDGPLLGLVEGAVVGLVVAGVEVVDPPPHPAMITIDAKTEEATNAFGSI